MKYIYLDNAAATRVDDEVVKAMLPFFTEHYAVASSQFSHQPGIAANEALEQSRQFIADQFKINPEELIFTSGATESNNLAIKGYAYQNKAKGNHIITSKTEHYSVLNTCKTLEKEGFEITYLDVEQDGRINLNDLKKAIKPNTILVTIQHANQETGTIQPIEEIAKICETQNIAFHTDASMSVGKIKIDLSKIPINMLSFSGNKIFGPKGVGALIVKKDTKVQKVLDGGFNEFNLRPGTENIPGIVGLAKALEVYTPEKLNKIKKLEQILLEKLLAIEDSELNGSLEKRLPGFINVSFFRAEGEAIILHLDMKGIGVITGSACFSRSLEPSYVLIAMGHTHERAHGSIRYTLSHYNTEEEILYTAKATEDVVKNLRSFSPMKK